MCLLLPLVSVSAKIKVQEHFQTKSLSWVWKVKVRDIKSSAVAYQSVDNHSKSFCLAAIKTVSAFKHKAGMMIVGWKSTEKNQIFLDKIKVSRDFRRNIFEKNFD